GSRCNRRKSVAPWRARSLLMSRRSARPGKRMQAASRENSSPTRVELILLAGKTVRYRGIRPNAQGRTGTNNGRARAAMLLVFCAMKLKTIYLVLCFLGAALPYWQLVPWVAAHGLKIRLMLEELFANRISAFFGVDVIVSAMV